MSGPTEAIVDAEGVHDLRLQPRVCPRCWERIRRGRETKRCPRCGISKPAEDFSHNPSRADHLDSRCRPCIRNIGRKEAHDNRMPQNVVEVGAVLGHLHEHMAPSWSSNGDSTPGILSLTDVVVVNYWTGERAERDEAAVYHHGKMLFPFRMGERVVLALGGGLLGKVRFTYTGRTRTAWEDEWPDSRLFLVDLFKRWYPDWSPPADLSSWPEDEIRVECPLAPHLDRTAKINAFGEFTCSRHTGSNVYYEDTGEAHHLPDYWNAVDVLMRRFGFKDEEAAVVELSRIEDEQLAVLAAEVWAA